LYGVRTHKGDWVLGIKMKPVLFRKHFVGEENEHPTPSLKQIYNLIKICVSPQQFICILKYSRKDYVRVQL
jgi:hypothetical protein